MKVIDLSQEIYSGLPVFPGNPEVSFERLVNIDKLPKIFMFHGVPLELKAGDESPVRTYEIIK